MYKTVEFINGLAVSGRRTSNDFFEIETALGEKFLADKLIFATGIKDQMLNIEGFAECWGISVLHCPYCHGYEVKDQKTGILGNGDEVFELATLISNWANDLTLFTDGASAFSEEQIEKLEKHHIKIEEKPVEKFEHTDGYIQNIAFKDGSKSQVEAIYARPQFTQHCSIPQLLGCELTEEGYIKADFFQETNVSGVFACGDNTTRMRTVANAVSMGTMAGISLSRKLISEKF